jgi:hypothetical protein
MVRPLPLFAWLASLTFPAQAALSGAIQCTGTQTTVKADTKIEQKSTMTKIFIIDEERKDVAYYNPEYGQAFSRCESLRPCKFNFYPLMIVSEGGDLHLIVDRQRGTIWEMAVNREDFPQDDYQFSGACQPVPMPAPDISRRKF